MPHSNLGDYVVDKRGRLMPRCSQFTVVTGVQKLEPRFKNHPDYDDFKPVDYIIFSLGVQK